MIGAARRYELPVGVLYAVGLTETGRAGSLHPFDMNVDGRPEASGNLPDALAKFHAAKAGGARMIDIGCMQINHHWHGNSFASLQAMFDPHENVHYAARFLKDLRRQQGSWTLAIARYNAGPGNDRAQKRYVCAVVDKLVKSGMGRWTAAAKEFCGSGAP